MFVFCQKDLIEDGWLGSVCDLLPYLLCFYTSLAADDSGLYIFI